MKTPVCIVRDHPECRKLIEKLTDALERTKQRIKFVQKQLDTINKTSDEERSKIWLEIEAELRKKFPEVMKAYDREAQFLGCDEGLSTIFYCDKKDAAQPFTRFIQHIFED